MNWQLIETAPKDGTRIIGYELNHGDHHVCIVWWDKSGWDDGEYRPGGRPGPTHWSPINPPQEGVVNPVTIARIGWLAVAERKRCAKILRALDKHYGHDEFDNRPFRIALKAILDPSAGSAAKAIKRLGG